MSKVYLLNTITESHQFNVINEDIKNWDYGIIYGKGLFKKHTGHYAHIELSLSKSSEDLSGNWIVWNTSNNHLPDYIGHKPFVEKVLSFFINYLSGLKGEKVKLTIEINDGSYHEVDTRPKDYENATIFALINAFDKNSKMISNNDLEIIKNCKLNAEKNQAENNK